MKAIQLVIGMFVFVISHLVIYFIRNLKVAAIFGVTLITLMSLFISGELPTFEVVTGFWMLDAAIGYATLAAVVGVAYTAYEMLVLVKMETQGKDISYEVKRLSKSVYNIPGWSFRDNMSK